MSELHIINRSKLLFDEDLKAFGEEINDIVNSSSFLVIGGAGSIGSAVVKEIFLRKPKVLHVVDLSENNLVELVRDIRSTLGYIPGDFRTFVIDYGSLEFSALLKSTGHYDYILNLAAIKHVRGEKDPFSLMHMLKTNILNTLDSFALAKELECKNYFAVSTDKAANPANMMGATKLIMEMCLMSESKNQPISLARFANVAFSDGSLLRGFTNRLEKCQPISAPVDVKRYFITHKEAGLMCLFSALLGKNQDVFIPHPQAGLNLEGFKGIAERYLAEQGFEPVQCASEEEARNRFSELVQKNQWPCYFFTSDTSGEKPYEEFFTDDEIVDLNTFTSVGVIKNNRQLNKQDLDIFIQNIIRIRHSGVWDMDELKDQILSVIPSFAHIETGKNLDQRM